MISAHRTGAYISGLRKAQDWTQLDLAQRLQVTHQAVSQWEKGASFPDVALLPQLARVFGVAVDDLLNGEPVQRTGRRTRGDMVEALARATPSAVAEIVRNDPEGVNLMLEAAPLTRPSQMNEVVAQLAGYSFTLKQVVDLAPYVGKDTLETILNSAGLTQVDGALLFGLAPYVGKGTLDRWVQHIAPDTLTMAQVEELAPFVGRETLNALVLERLMENQPLPFEQLEHLAPFLGREGLGALIQRLPAGALPIEQILKLAPYCGRDELDRLNERLEDEAILPDYVHELAPYLSRPSLKRVVMQIKGGLSAEMLVELAPYLDKETLAEMLGKK